MSVQNTQHTIEDFLSQMGISFKSVDILESELPDYIKFSIDTDESGVLIGKDGEHLSALSFVIRKVAEKKMGESTPKFFIDVGGYQSNKIQKIQKVAKIMAERAVSFKRDIELPPMGAYDRLVIHSTLSEHSGVETESEGQGRFRRVIVRYRLSSDTEL